MLKSNYQIAKAHLKGVAKRAKKEHPKDIPMINQVINDEADYLCKEGNLTEYQKNCYTI